MNWIDKSIGWVAPERGMRRLRARAALQAMQRIYEAAQVSRSTQNWVTGGTSANSEIEGALYRLRTRSRDAVRNNPYAQRAIDALVANTVGCGIVADWKGPATKTWQMWIKESDYHNRLDFHGLQALTARAVWESGECLIRRIRTTSAEAGKSGVPLKLQVLEADYLDLNRHGVLANGNLAIGGVEVDRTGRVQAYWLYSQHPGDAPLFSPNLYSTRVLADDVILVYDPLRGRPGQLRGVPRLAAGMIKLRNLDEWHEAMMVKKKIESCFTAFVKTSDESKTIVDSAKAQLESDGTRTEQVSPGLINYMRPDEEVTFGQPTASAGEGEFTAGELRAIAMAAGITYEQLTGDLTRVNFSSMRAGRQEFQKLVEQFRWLVFIPMVCDRVAGWFEDAAYTAGKVRTTGYVVSWTPPRWEYVNPLDDVKTDKEELSAGLSSLSAQIRKRGDDPDTVLNEIADERKKLKALGIELDYSIGKGNPADMVGAPGTTPSPPAAATP